MKRQTHKCQTIYRISLKKAKYYIEHRYNVIPLIESNTGNHAMQ